MALTKRYETINGRIRAESAGGTRTGYLPDALGSVTATVTEAGAIVNTYRYKPYGTQLAKTGGGADPSSMWVGQWGYRTSVDMSVYIRSRHYRPKSASWQTIDKYWPKLEAYTYANSNPTSSIDPTGAKPNRCIGIVSMRVDVSFWCKSGFHDILPGNHFTNYGKPDGPVTPESLCKRCCPACPSDCELYCRGHIYESFEIVQIDAGYKIDCKMRRRRSVVDDCPHTTGEPNPWDIFKNALGIIPGIGNTIENILDIADEFWTEHGVNQWVPCDRTIIPPPPAGTKPCSGKGFKLVIRTATDWWKVTCRGKPAREQIIKPPPGTGGAGEVHYTGTGTRID